jgi:signal transduction histidine kinase
MVDFLIRSADRQQRPWVRNLGLTLALVGMFTAVRWFAGPFVALPIPFTFYVPAIVLVTALCGSRWGYATIVMCLMLTVYLWLPPRMSLRFSKEADLSDLVVWGAVSAFIVAILSALDHALATEARQARELAEKSHLLGLQAAALTVSEAKLRTYAVDLEKLVDERTAKLTETVAELETFAYTISHDLRSPLRAMQGFAHLALEEAAGQLSPTATGYLRRIDQATQRMDDLIRDLLVFNRAGPLDAPTQVVDVAALVAEAVQRHPEWLATGAVLNVRQPMRPVRAVRTSLYQSLSNLLENAFKFVARDRTARVDVSTETRGPNVRILIADNGIGMRPEFLAHIFTPFHRGHPDGGFNGRGIGLAVAKKSVLRMGGDIGVTTTVGEGSIFWIELPTGESRAQAPR